MAPRRGERTTSLRTALAAARSSQFVHSRGECADQPSGGAQSSPASVTVAAFAVSCIIPDCLDADGCVGDPTALVVGDDIRLQLPLRTSAEDRKGRRSAGTG